MSKYFKVIYLINDKEHRSKIKKVVVFTSITTSDKLNRLLHEKDKALSFFSKPEIDYILKHKIQVEVAGIDIYIDDTIEDVKKKIILHNSDIIYEEIYLFYKKVIDFDLVDFYHNVSQYEKLDITNGRLCQALVNYDNIDISSIEKKEIYEYEDLLDITFDKQGVLKKEMLGQHIVLNKLEYNYIVNPYECIIEDKTLDEDVIETNNRGLLLD